MRQFGLDVKHGSLARTVAVVITLVALAAAGGLSGWDSGAFGGFSGWLD